MFTEGLHMEDVLDVWKFNSNRMVILSRLKKTKTQPQTNL